MSEQSEQEEGPLMSEVAAEIADDPGMDDGTAMRKLLHLFIDLSENMMVTLWNIEESLALRKTEKGQRHDA